MLILIVLAQAWSATCSHPLFCNASLLQQAATQGWFTDSKEFVDLVLRRPLEEILKTDYASPTWLQDNFLRAESLIEPHLPPDYLPSPAWHAQLAPALRPLASALHQRWLNLAKTYRMPA
jgi:alpha,alpha-trehalase